LHEQEQQPISHQLCVRLHISWKDIL